MIVMSCYASGSIQYCTVLYSIIVHSIYQSPSHDQDRILLFSTVQTVLSTVYTVMYSMLDDFGCWMDGLQ